MKNEDTQEKMPTLTVDRTKSFLFQSRSSDPYHSLHLGRLGSEAPPQRYEQLSRSDPCRKKPTDLLPTERMASSDPNFPLSLKKIPLAALDEETEEQSVRKNRVTGSQGRTLIVKSKSPPTRNRKSEPKRKKPPVLDPILDRAPDISAIPTIVVDPGVQPPSGSLPRDEDRIDSTLVGSPPCIQTKQNTC